LMGKAGGDLTGKLTLSGRIPATRYAVRVSQAQARAEAEFVTAPAADTPARVTFIWSGDLGGGGYCRPLDGGYRIFRPMAERRADFFMFVGDTIYADVPCDRAGVVPGADFRARTLAQYRARHRYQLEDPPLQALLRSTSVYAIWDDHEVRNDFSGPHDALMPIGRRALLDYWPIAPPAEEPTRLYRRFRWGRLLDVFILDTRQYRSRNSDTDGVDKSMLGGAQRHWLLEGVTSSRALWKVVVTSVSLSIPTGQPQARDSWTGVSAFGLPQDGAGFVTERDAILDHFRKNDVRNLVFVASDVHHAEAIRHDPPSSWPLHVVVPRARVRARVGNHGAAAPPRRDPQSALAVCAWRCLQFRRGGHRARPADGAAHRRRRHRDVHACDQTRMKPLIGERRMCRP